MKQTMTKAQFARHINKTRQYVTQLVKNGRTVQNDAGLIIVDATTALMDDTSDPSKVGVVERHASDRAEKTGEPTPQLEESTGKASSVYQQSKAMREKYNAMLAKLEFEKAIGKVLDLNDVTLAISRAATDLRGQLETLPDRFAAQFAAENDPAKIRLQAAETIEHLLTGLEKHFKKLSES